MRQHLTLGITILAILGGCAAQAARTIDIHSANYSGEVVALRIGDTLRVRLPSNPTTGYSWAQSSAAPAELSLLDSTFAAPESPAVGAPGEQLFRFVTARPGWATLTWFYARPWESGVAPADTVRIPFAVSAR